MFDLLSGFVIPFPHHVVAGTFTGAGAGVGAAVVQDGQVAQSVGPVTSRIQSDSPPMVAHGVAPPSV